MGAALGALLLMGAGALLLRAYQKRNATKNGTAMIELPEGPSETNEVQWHTSTKQPIVEASAYSARYELPGHRVVGELPENSAISQRT